MTTYAGIGTPLSRVDGVKKVTGAARYAAECPTDGLLYGVIHSSRIAKGRIVRIDTKAALAVPGVVDILTHENRPRIAWLDRSYKDQVAPPGDPFRALYDDKILYAGQPIALVVAETFEIARYAVTLIDVEYETEPHETNLHEVLDKGFFPRRTRTGFAKPKSRGDAQKAFASAPVKVAREYHLKPEHHNPMEMFGSTVIWEGDGKLTIHDKTQGAPNSHAYVCEVFGFSKKDVTVLSPFVGGAFGSGLRPQHQLYLATMAAKHLERSVRVSMTRQEMFGHGYRPECVQQIQLGAERDGRLTAIVNRATTATSMFENYMEVIVNWGGMLYRCDNAELDYKIAQIDTHTPCDMRAPGAATGQNLFEIAMDELAYEAGIDPLELRMINYADEEEMTGHPYTSKALRSCYSQGAERFGWDKRSHEPRSMRDGTELVGWGMATGIWEAAMQKTSSRAILDSSGNLEVATATADIGTGTYTIMTAIAAETLGIAVEKITAKLGDSNLPPSPVQGGSWTAASTGAAVQLACKAVGEQLFKAAKKLEDTPFADTKFVDVEFTEGRMVVAADPARALGIVEIMRAAGLNQVEAEETAKPSLVNNMVKSRNCHSAVFAEVKVDEELGVVRVTRIVSAVAAGRIINPKTARSQILGGVVWGMGMALEEETMADHRIGRFMNHSLAEYHVPVNADVFDIDVIFVDEPDGEVSPLGVKGVGEIGIVGTAGAIANAIFHATGTRVRSLPITIDKLL